MKGDKNPSRVPAKGTRPQNIRDWENADLPPVQTGQTQRASRQFNVPVRQYAPDVPQSFQSKPVTPPAIGLPKDYQGGQLGPNGEALPPNAAYFDAYGQPYFGPAEVKPGVLNEIGAAVQNYWGGVMYRLGKPTEEQKSLTEGISQEDLDKAQETALANAPLGLVGGIKTLVENRDTEAQIVENAMHDFNNVPGFLGVISRGVSEVIRGVGELFNVASSTLERGIGTAGILLDDKRLAVGMEDDNFVVRLEGGIGATLDEAWQASRVAYESFLEPAVRDEYIRRYRAGENPILLAQELSKGNELKDLVGQMVLDPLALIGAFSKGTKAVQAINKAEDLISVTKTSSVPAIAKLANTLDNYDDVIRNGGRIEDAAKVVSDALRTRVDDVEKAVVKMARDTSITAFTADAKAAVMTDAVHDVMQAALPAMRDEDVAQNLIDAVVIANKLGDEAGQLEAVARLANSKARNVLFSELGLRSMNMVGDFLQEGGQLSVSKINTLRSIIKEAQKLGSMDLATAQMIEKLEPILAATVKKAFPSVLEQVANVEKIKKLAAEGKPIPAGLARYIENGKIVEVPAGVQFMAKVDRKLKSGVNPINKFFAAVYMGISPGFAFRNAITNMMHMFVDDADSVPGFFTTEKIKQGFKAWGVSPSAAIKGFEAAGPGGDIGTLQIAGKGGFWNTFSKLSGKVESKAGMAVAWSAFKKSMQRMLPKAMTGISDDLLKAGFSDQDVLHLERLIWDNKGDVAKAVETFTSGAERKTLAGLGKRLISKLEKQDLADDVQDALRTSASPEEFQKKLDNIFEQYRAFGERAQAEELLPPADDLYMAEQQEINALVDQGEPLQRSGADLLSRRQAMAAHTMGKYQQALQSMTDQIADMLLKAGDGPGVQRVRAQANQVFERIRSIRAQEAADAQRARAEVLRATREAYASGNSDEAARLWDEFLKLGGVRDKLHIAARERVIKEYEGLGKALTQQFPDLDTQLFKDATEWGKLNQDWDNVDEQYFFRTQKIRKAGSKEKLDVVPEGQTDAPIDTPLPVGEGPITPARAAQEQAQGVKELLQMVKDKANSAWDATQAVKVAYTPAQEAALKKFGEVVGRRMVDAKAAASEVANAARKFTLLDYSQKRNFDVALAYIYPYQFWYGRTYVNWMQRLARDPYILAAYSRYRDYMEKIHANMPDWWKYNVNTNELLGMDSENPLFFNLEATLNPLNGLTGVDFEDPDRQKTWWTATLNSLGKFGPSIWTPLTLATGITLGLQGDVEGAEGWVGRSIPITGTIKAASNLLGIRGNNGLLTPGGLELDPAMWIQGGAGKHDRNRIGRMLGQMQAEGLITAEQAADAAYSQSGEIWNEAWNRAEAARAPGNVAAGLFGVGFRMRNVNDIQIDQFYTEMRALQTRRTDLSPEEYRDMWQVLEKKYPFMSTLLMSRKSTEERDEAFAYNVLSRIPPGQQKQYVESLGLDNRLIEKFYNDKGFITENGRDTYGQKTYTKWSEADKQRFMSGMLSLGAVLAVPPTTLRDEWNETKNRYAAMNAQAKQLFGEQILDEVDTYFSMKNVSSDAAEDFLDTHPEVNEYQDWKYGVIQNDEFLSEYYGGVDFVEGYLRRKMYGDAAKKFGEDIFKVQSAYFQIKDEGGNTKLFLAEHPQLYDWWDYKTEQENMIATQLESMAGLFPPTPQAITRPDADLQSIAAQDVLQSMQQTSSVDQDVAAIVASYSNKSAPSDFSITEYLSREGEKRWPGITRMLDTFDGLAAQDAGLAQSYYKKHPELAQYKTWEKAARKQYNSAQKGRFGGQAINWRETLGDSLYRLVKDAQNGDSLPPSVESRLAGVAEQMGVSVEELVGLIP